ncbi:MAG: hypothetical protein HQ564_09855 [Candidatus Saganbacteria bacterium]|nr:hypothetical protein [Candidatus Saganbacteria bacterium]
MKTKEIERLDYLEPKVILLTNKGSHGGDCESGGSADNVCTSNGTVNDGFGNCVTTGTTNSGGGSCESGDTNSGALVCSTGNINSEGGNCDSSGNTVTGGGTCVTTGGNNE